MTQHYSFEIVVKDTAEAVIIPLKDGIYSLNRVYEALIVADVDPITGQCFNYDYIRQQIVQAHQHLKRSENLASSGLKSLDTNLEFLIRDNRELEQEMTYTKQILDDLRTEQASNEQLLSNSHQALEQARRCLNSTIQTLQEQENRKKNAEIVTGVGAGLLVIPIIGWIAGSAMLIGGGVELDQAQHAVRVAEEEVRKSETEVKKYESKVPEYESKIYQTKCNISQKHDKLKNVQDEIQKVKKQIESVVEFQNKSRSAVQLLGVLSGRASVAEHQTRSFILQEPVMKVVEDVIKATAQITGNELLYVHEMPRLINQMKENNQQLAAICASENSSNNCPYV